MREAERFASCFLKKLSSCIDGAKFEHVPYCEESTNGSTNVCGLLLSRSLAMGQDKRLILPS